MRTAKHTIRIEIRKDKTDRKGNAPLRLISQTKGHREYHNLGIKIPIENWCEHSQSIKYSPLNGLRREHLRKLEQRISGIKKRYETQLVETECKQKQKDKVTDMDNPFELILSELSEIKEILSVTRSNPSEPIEIIDRKELQRRLNIAEPTVIRWGKRGIIPEMRIGPNVRYNWPSVVRALEKNVK